MRRTIISLNRYISDFRSYVRFFSITEIENICEYFMAKTQRFSISMISGTLILSSIDLCIDIIEITEQTRVTSRR